MTGSPLDGLGKAIWEELRRTITRRGKCVRCKKYFWLSQMREDFLGRWWCKEHHEVYYKEAGR